MASFGFLVGSELFKRPLPPRSLPHFPQTVLNVFSTLRFLLRPRVVTKPSIRPPARALQRPRAPSRTEPAASKYLGAEPRIAQPGLWDPDLPGPGRVQQVWAGPPGPARRFRASPGAQGAPDPVGQVSFHHPQSVRAPVQITLPPPLPCSLRNSRWRTRRPGGEVSAGGLQPGRLGGPALGALRPPPPGHPAQASRPPHQQRNENRFDR